MKSKKSNRKKLCAALDATSLVFMSYKDAIDRVKCRAVDPESLMVVDINLACWLHELLHKRTMTRK
jgi:hypothetical protein